MSKEISKKVWHKAHLIHEELMNAEFTSQEIMDLAKCIKQIEKELW